MSNLIDNSYTQLNNLIQINADDIQAESINTKALYINNILFDPSGNYINDYVTLSTAQNISNKTFTGTTIFSSIQLNDNLIVNTGGTTILNSNLALINFLSGTSSNINNRFTTNETNITALQTKTTNMSFASNITTFTGTLAFPTGSISFNAIVGTACTLGQNQTITGTKTFSAVQNFTSNLRLDGSLLVGTAGNVILTNATLQKIAYLANVTSDINATFNNYVLTTSLNTTLANYVLTTALNTTLANYVLTTALNTTLANYVLTTALNTTLNDYVLTTALNTALNNYVSTTALNTALNPINTDISTLNTKTQYISSTSLNTTILNTTNIADLLISLTINGFSKGDFNNVITQCSSLTSNCQTQITNAQNKADTAKTNADNAQNTANTAAALAGTANAAAIAAAGIATGAASVAAGAASGVTALETQVEGIETDVAALQIKTTQISYSLATDRTTISQTLYSPFLEIGNLTSGFTQTATDQITLAGILRCNNRVEINNTLELINNNNIIVEGIINQDNATPPNNGVNQFLAPTNISNLTCNGTNTNINSTNFNITSITNIKNISTSPLLSLLLPTTVTAARNLQGLLIGREQTLNQQSNCNVGYNYIADGDFGNYGYLGLNVNTLNLKESFRWFSTGCSIPTGNLTISEGNLTVTAGNISLPTGNLSLTNGDITLTNGEINLTSGDLNVVSGDATLTSGDLSLGTGNISVNNGDLNIFNGELKTNTISKYSGNTLDINSNGVGSILNLNAPTINIGYNEGLAAVNTINIGSTTSFSTINLNGLVVSAFGFNIGQVTQW